MERRSFLDRHGDLIAALAVTGVAMAARWHNLGDKPYWLDEIFTLRRANQDLSGVISDSLHSHHLPTYFLLIWAILPLGLNEAVLRLPSALFGAMSAGLVCSIANRLAGRVAGVAGGLLMALSPFQVQMGQEARSYALVTCLILLGVWGAIRVLEPEQSQEGAKSSSRAGWIAYFCGTAGALLVLPISIPWFVAANIGVAGLAAFGMLGRGPLLRRWVAVQAAIVAVTAPCLIGLAFVDKGNFVHAFDWVPPSLPAILEPALAATYLMRISDMASFELLPLGVPGIGIIAAGLAAAGLWSMRRSPWALVILGLALLALPVALIGISAVKAIAIPRYFTWGAGPFFVLAGIGIASLRVPVRAQAFACAALMVLASANLEPYYDAETKPRWDLAAMEVGGRLQPDDVIYAADSWIPYIFGHFSERLAPGPAVTVTQNIEEAAVSLAAGHRVWAVYGRVGQGAMEPFDAFQARIAMLGPASVQWAEGRHIRVLRFDPARPEPVTDANDPPATLPE